MAVADCRPRRRQGGARGAGAARRARRGARCCSATASSSPSLGGTYRTAGDMNITPDDLDVVAETCPWVYGTTGAGGNSGRGTARGVLHGIRASVEHVFGSPDLAGRTRARAGRRRRSVTISRATSPPRARACSSPTSTRRGRRATGCRGRCRPRERRSTTECDVYSPCAVGGTLNAETIPRLRCRIVAGSANNQLAEPEDAERLHARRDPLRARLRGQRRRRHPAARARATTAGTRTSSSANLAGDRRHAAQLYRDADAAGITPAAAAERLAAERIAGQRDSAPA